LSTHSLAASAAAGRCPWRNSACMLRVYKPSSTGTACCSVTRLPHGCKQRIWRLQDGQQPSMLTILASFVPKQRGDQAFTQSEIRAWSSGLSVRRRHSQVGTASLALLSTGSCNHGCTLKYTYDYMVGTICVCMFTLHLRLHMPSC
jgi:hypothetical protein